MPGSKLEFPQVRYFVKYLGVINTSHLSSLFILCGWHSLGLHILKHGKTIISSRNVRLRVVKMQIARHLCRPVSEAFCREGPECTFTLLEGFQGCCCCAGLLLYMWKRFDRWILPWTVIGWAVSMVSLNFIWLVNSRTRHPLNSLGWNYWNFNY